MVVVQIYAISHKRDSRKCDIYVVLTLRYQGITWRTGLGRLADSRLNVHCENYGYQYSDIMLALFCVYP